MGLDSRQPLTPPLSIEEAKARLREKAENATLGALMAKRTWPLLAMVVAGGFVAARIGLPTLVGSVLIQRAAPILLGVLLGKRHHSESSESSSLKSK
jgi:hypothetical protein